MGMVHRKSPPVGGLFLRKILILAENDGGAGEREGRGGDGDSNEVIGTGGGVLLVIGLGGVLGRADNDDGGGAFLLDGGDGALGISSYLGASRNSCWIHRRDRSVARLNSNNLICFNGSTYIVGRLGSVILCTLVAQTDITVGALCNGIGESVILNGGIYRSSFGCIDDTNRGIIIIGRIIKATIIKCIARNVYSESIVLLMVYIDRH